MLELKPKSKAPVTIDAADRENFSPSVEDLLTGAEICAAGQAEVREGRTRIVMEAVIRADGSVGDVRVVRSLDHEFGLDRVAVETARQWRFKPATKPGKPVPMLVELEMQFKLK